MGDDEPCIVGVHRKQAGDDHLARQIARLLQHIVEAGPVDFRRIEECDAAFDGDPAVPLTCGFDVSSRGVIRIAETS